MNIYKVLFLICFFFMTFYVHAKEYEYSGNCKFNGYMEDFEHCLNRELTRYDRKLNDIYRSFFKKKPDKNLKKAEELWVKFKEADCHYMASEVNEGREFPAVEKACLINKTKARIADLKRSFFYAEWFEKNN
jgi:uncharacterized protein YecT (DUF1311 family)